MNRFCAWLVNFHYNCRTQPKAQCLVGHGERSSTKGSGTCLISSWQPVHVHELALVIQHQLRVGQDVRGQRHRRQERVVIHGIPQLDQRLGVEREILLKNVTCQYLCSIHSSVVFPTEFGIIPNRTPQNIPSCQCD